MKTFTLENRPEALIPMRKTGHIAVIFVEEPFHVETQEGSIFVSDSTVDDWDGGYFVAYPSDGSKPYAISPAFIRDNYLWMD